MIPAPRNPDGAPPATGWCRRVEDFILEDGDVHVWRADLDRKSAEIGHLALSLSGDEHRKVEECLYFSDRNRTIASRGILRDILSRYLDIHPNEIDFRLGSHGKPEVNDRESTLRFNMSHSGGLALYVVARRRMVGIDVERIDAARANYPTARARLFPGMDDVPVEQFFEGWTRHEAMLKAQGTGLRQTRTSSNSLFVQRIEVPDGYAAALALSGAPVEVRVLEWAPRAGRQVSTDFTKGTRVPLKPAFSR